MVEAEKMVADSLESVSRAEQLALFPVGETEWAAFRAAMSAMAIVEERATRSSVAVSVAEALFAELGECPAPALSWARDVSQATALMVLEQAAKLGPALDRPLAAALRSVHDTGSRRARHVDRAMRWAEEKTAERETASDGHGDSGTDR